MNVSAIAADAPRGLKRGEVTAVHTRILRTTLAVDDCYAYWQKVDTAVPASERARVAFSERWFGLKSEARVRTLVSDMLERFDAFPQALELLQRLGTVPSTIRPWLCHLHVALADPIYRRFTGEFLSERRALGYADVNREQGASWIEESFPGRWSAITSEKFGSNLLAAAFEAGIVAERRDPRRLTPVAVPDAVIGYALYLLRDLSFEGSLTDNLYLRGLGIGADSFRVIAGRVPGIRFAELGGVAELTFTAPSLLAFGLGSLKVSP